MVILDESAPVPYTVERVRTGLLEQARRLEWTILESGRDKVTASQERGGSSFPIRIYMRISPMAVGSKVILRAESEGIGPVEEEYLKIELDRMIIGLRTSLDKGQGKKGTRSDVT
jgi:hypothetical protein